MHTSTAILFMFLCNLALGDCPEELKEGVLQSHTSEGVQPISEWDPALKPPFPMGPFLAAAAPAPYNGMWLYRKVYNPQDGVSLVESRYFGGSGEIWFLERYSGFEYFYIGRLAHTAHSIAFIRSIIADCAKQVWTPTVNPASPTYAIEYGGFDPANGGKAFLIQTHGAKDGINPSVNAATLVSFIDRISGL